MGKIRDLFKKIIRDTKRTFNAKSGTRKNRNSKDLTAENINKRWQFCTQKKLCKKDLHNLDIHNGVITHLRARHPRMQSQVGLRKHHYEQS